MKLKILFSLLLCFSLAACEDDDNAIVPIPIPDIDTESPVISINTPAQGTAFNVIERVLITGIVTDNVGLKETKSYLTSAELPAYRLPLSMVQYPVNTKRQMYDESVRLPVDIEPGRYELKIEASDRKNNATSHSVDIVIDDTDLDEAAFIEAFLMIGLFSTLDWLGYAFQSQKGIEETGLSFAFNLMANNDWNEVISEAEWNQFTSDFYFENMKFEDWDTDTNKSLSSTEFQKAIDSQGLIQTWDQNNDGFLGETEMGKGIFSRWDHNKNKKLSREEYHVKFRTQFHFGW